jgi:hypothetical protein
MRVLADAIEVVDHPSDFCVQAAIQTALRAVSNGEAA